MNFQQCFVFLLIILATLVGLNNAEVGDTCRRRLLVATPCGSLNTLENEDCCGEGACCQFKTGIFGGKKLTGTCVDNEDLCN